MRSPLICAELVILSGSLRAFRLAGAGLHSLWSGRDGSSAMWWSQGSAAGRAAALRAAREAAEQATVVRGPDHRRAIEADVLVAWLIRDVGGPPAALGFHRDLAARAARTLGTR
jgi:hypothetical protein